MDDLIGMDLGRYRILERLGEGGMATVYKAYDTRLERDVAVKVIRTDLFGPAMIEAILKRFDREAKGLARLTHPNIVGVIDYGEYEGSPYLVMTYLVGGTLKKMLGQRMPWQEAVRLLLPIAHALEFAHQHNIIHRDVKPSNILLTENGQPMLTDFGIAKILDLEEGQTLTAPGVGIGTPEYMSPEQGLGRAVDARTDVYSLGIVFYELITGRKPYIADTPMAVLEKHLHDPLPRPSSLVPDLPDDVEKLLLKSLAKETRDRYQSMDELAAALENLLHSHAVQVAVSAGQGRLVQAGQVYPTQLAPKPAPFPTRGAAPPAETVHARQQPPVGGTRQFPTAGLPSGQPAAGHRLNWLWIAGGLLLGICAIAAVVFGVLYIANRPASTLPPVAALPSPSPTTRPVPVDTGVPTQPAPSIPSDTPPQPVFNQPILLTYMSGSSYESANADVFIVGENGNSATCIACNICYEGEPSVSPDGSSVVFQSACSAAGTDLYLVSTSGYGSRALTSTASLSEREPAFSPDGSQIAYRVSAVDTDRNLNGEIYVMNADGTDQRSLGIQGRGPVWSPDGSRLAYMSNESGTWQIYVYTFSTRQSQQITRLNVNCRWPAWSPDGQYLAYNTSPTAVSLDPDSIWYIKADGSGTPTLVVDAEGGAGRPSWSSNGWIAFNTVNGIECIQQDGNGRHVIISDSKAYAASWSR
jgi:tRNA A-37 threonylcarbamoyl transferase component Bud32